ncbi:cellulose synthase-like protein G3 isoform X2 [Cornus florida]|uniref:cellulose synthase-like protein G3 isoform X2 n=1 Tax=Cornus florida TaxID=4283 RepID=UPI00289DBF53|nr:cellulose synthase-like protein G3 isoform X2 [Cornus florida]
MEGITTTTTKVPLHTLSFARATAVNRVFAAVYTCAIFTLFYHHVLKIHHSTTLLSSFISISLFFSDLLLGLMWFTTQSFRMRPIHRQEYPENLDRVLTSKKDFPGLDVFICTADPYKEPPMSVVNTALSVMAYDYPAEKLSVYVSDDGGSELTLFALMEAAKFGRHWLPFCKENNIIERSPDAYFRSNYSNTENMKVLTENGKDRDITSHSMPNLVYISREKNRMSSHNFKAGALNVLLRVSGIMTNAPIILNLDCDMYSNDPLTPHRVLCYFCDPAIRTTLGYMQFPQRFRGLNKADIYACEYKRAMHISPPGMDGLAGPDYAGTGCFFSRRAFFGGPISTSLVTPEIPELFPDHIVNKPIHAHEILALAHHVADCSYENHTNWGYKMGFRYGSLVEDFFTGYLLMCEGWKAVFCQPERAAFWGDAPISLNDALNQNKRWNVGLLEVAFSKYSPMIFGAHAMGPLMSLCYTHYVLSPIWCIPITIYAFLPQLALLNGLVIFPKVSEQWFFLYLFLFLGAYGQDYLEFILAQSSTLRWWSDQRMWMIRGLSSFLFGTIEYLTKTLGIVTHGFNVTSKVVDDQQSKRYDEGRFEFGVSSPMFVPLAMAAAINLVAFLMGFSEVFMRGGELDGLFVQMFIAGFVVLNCWPVYEAMVFRFDKGRMPTKITIISIFLSWLLCKTFSITLRT